MPAEGSLTVDTLQRFVRIRNRSQHPSNLQFAIDAEAAGFTVDDLGRCTTPEPGVYVWDTPCGRLIERHRRLSLEPIAAP